jgi:diacylglycerol kinase (ATP)
MSDQFGRETPREPSDESTGITANAPRSLTFSGRLRSVRWALRGVAVMLRTQHNAWLHLAATVIVVITGGLVGLSAGEWCWIVLAVVAVWTAEALNTAFEFLTDVASPTFHPLAEQAKDVAAGAVLIASIGAAAIGLLVFTPHLLEWF